MAVATPEPSAVPMVPEYVQDLPVDQKKALTELCALDDQYLEAVEKMRKEMAEVQARFERTVAPPLLASRKALLAESKLPLFWSRAMEHSHVAELVEEWDKPALAYLDDITTEPLADPAKGWKLHFHFNENKFFTSKVLTKTYHTERESKWDADLDTLKIESTLVAWKEGADLTVEAVTKGKGKKKKTHSVPRDSFFRFFYPLGEGAEFPPTVPNDEESEDEEEEDEEERMEELINTDVSYAEAFKHLIIPHAVRHYTQEAVDMEAEEGSLASEEAEEGSEDEAEFQTPLKTTKPKAAAKK